MKKVLKQTESGILYKDDPDPPPPKPKYWPLEIEDQTECRAVSLLFNEILNRPSFSYRNIICTENKEVVNARRSLLLAVAHQFVGPDWEFEELT